MSTGYQKKIQKRVCTSSPSLSTRTKAILKRLQGSPIKTTGAPVRTSGIIASRPKRNSDMKTRLQMLVMRTRTQPYWTDLFRAKEMNQKDTTLPEEADEIQVIPPVVEEPSIQKPSRNFFSAKELEDDDGDAVVPIAAPPSVFTFAPPRCLKYPLQNVTPAQPNHEPSPTPSPSADNMSRSYESDEESNSAESRPAEGSSAESTAKSPEKPEATNTSLSIKTDTNSSYGSQSIEWSCSTCFVQNKGNVCVCCATAKDGTSTFAPTTKPTEAPTKYTFGVTANDGTSTLTPIIKVPKVCMKYAFGVCAKPPAENDAPVAPARKDEPIAPVKKDAPVAPCGSQSVEWTCQTCFVQNKGDVCVCCATAKDGTSTFALITKPIEAPTKYTFGVTANNGTSTLTPIIKVPEACMKYAFGVSTKASAENDALVAPARKDEPIAPVKKDAPVAPARKDEPIAPVKKDAPVAPCGSQSVEWTCQTCFVQNKGDVCACCATAKDGTSTFASTTKPTEAPTKYTFGVTAKDGTSTFVPTTKMPDYEYFMETNSSAPGTTAPSPVTTAVTAPSTVSGTLSSNFGIAPAPNPFVFGNTIQPSSNQSMPGVQVVELDNQNSSAPSNVSLFSAPNPAPIFSAPISIPVFKDSPMTDFNFGATAAPNNTQPFMFGSNPVQPESSGMKLECSILGVPIRGNAKPGKPLKGVVCIGKGKLKSANGQNYQLQVSTAKARNQQPIELSPQNITSFICTHAAAGKVTIEFAQPSLRVMISLADPNRLARFAHYLRKIKNGENPDDLDDVKEVKSTELQVQAKLAIDNSRSYYSDYAKSFPNTLQTLSITNCDLSRLDLRWFSNTNLTTLCLSGNKLASVEGRLKKLVLIKKLLHLQRLDLSNNMICTLPEDLQFPESLVDLSLRNNSFNYIPQAVCKVGSLVLLDISHNPIRSLPRKQCWPRLKNLYFNDTWISFMPFYFTRMTLDSLRCCNRIAPEEEYWEATNNVEYRSLEMPTLESIAAAVTKQHRLNEKILPWTIKVDNLIKQCCRCLKYKPAFYIVPMLVLRNPMQLARHVDTLNDVPVLIERCIQCTRSPGLY